MTQDGYDWPNGVQDERWQRDPELEMRRIIREEVVRPIVQAIAAAVTDGGLFAGSAGGVATLPGFDRGANAIGSHSPLATIQPLR